MNKFYYLLLSLAVATNLQAQITITSASFPAPGDTLKYATDINPDGVAITAPGAGASTWDFTSLGPNFNTTTVYRPASEGTAAASFPTATLVVVGAADQSETYYGANTNSFNVIGYSGAPPVNGLPVQTQFYFDPPSVERRAPMNFFDINQTETNISIGFATADLPAGLLDSLGIPTSLVDSIRIRSVSERFDVVDAFGSLTIPGGTYDVLREKRTEHRDTRLDIHTFFGWQDITDIVTGGGNGSQFGTDTTVHYLFLSNTEKELIADVTMSDDGLSPLSVTYKDNGLPNATDSPQAEVPTVTVTPNPARSSALFAFGNLAPGNYDLHLYDATGRLALVKTLPKEGGHVMLDELGGGMYFYHIVAEGKRPIASGKLVVE